MVPPPLPPAEEELVDYEASVEGRGKGAASRQAAFRAS